MIVYNVKRRWFAMKEHAERARKATGLRPDALRTIRVENREELAWLLDALCEPTSDKAMLAATGLSPAQADALLDDAHIMVSDDLIVPKFMRDDDDRRNGRRPW